MGRENEFVELPEINEQARIGPIAIQADLIEGLGVQLFGAASGAFVFLVSGFDVHFSSSPFVRLISRRGDIA
jgi:hypothetical protein